jgi:hypothetical protein
MFFVFLISPSYHSWIDNPNNIWRRVQIIATLLSLPVSSAQSPCSLCSSLTQGAGPISQPQHTMCRTVKIIIFFDSTLRKEMAAQIYQPTWRHIPEDSNVRIPHCENLQILIFNNEITLHKKKKTKKKNPDSIMSIYTAHSFTITGTQKFA